MLNIVIFYNSLKQEAKKAAESLQSLLKSSSQVILSPIKRQAGDWNVVTDQSSLAIAFGGDGTFLASSKQCSKYSVPLLGINFGHLGFLSDSGDFSIQELADEILQENFLIETRTMLEARVHDFQILALNDIAVNRSLNSNLLHIDLYIDDNLLHSYRSDGIVISTPTGSTAYALSAGGALMDPNIHAFQIVPIAAHSLNSRAHVISDTQTIVLDCKKDLNAPFVIQADGQGLIALEPGSKIVIKKSKQELKLVKLKKYHRSFYSILRDKMKWGSTIN